MVTANSPQVSRRQRYASLSSSLASLCSLHKLMNGPKPSFSQNILHFIIYFPAKTHISSFQCDNLISSSSSSSSQEFILPQYRTDVWTESCAVTLFLLPRGEKWPLAVEGLREGVAQSDYASLAAWTAALYNNSGHLHQLNGTLPVLQCLCQVQHLWTNRIHVWNIETVQCK